MTETNKPTETEISFRELVRQIEQTIYAMLTVQKKIRKERKIRCIRYHSLFCGSNEIKLFFFKRTKIETQSESRFIKKT